MCVFSEAPSCHGLLTKSTLSIPAAVVSKGSCSCISYTWPARPLLKNGSSASLNGRGDAWSP